MIRRRIATVAAAAALSSVACSEEGSERADSVGVPAAAAHTPEVAQPQPPAPSPTDTTPPRLIDTGSGLALWNTANLEKRLDLQGMAPRRSDRPVHHPFLAVPGTSYMVGNAELQIFIYESAAAAARDVARLDTATVSPRGAPVKWPARPTLVTNNNLVAIFLGQNALQIERVQRAIMAGLSPGT
jgi:hypothetical protein